MVTLDGHSVYLDAGAEASFRVFLTPSANLAIEPITMPVLE